MTSTDAALRVASALAPYPWRRFTASMLARHAVAALDRAALAAFIAGLPGVAVGPLPPPDPVDADDPRLPAVLDTLAACSWRRAALPALSARLVRAAAHTQMQ